MLRLGVFGGTFDPPHLGHLAVAESARVDLRLDRVLFVPAGTPPHKSARMVTPARHRVAMTRLAVRGNPAFAVATDELERDGPSYTIETLERLRARHPRARLFLVIGEDSLRELPAWHAPEAIAALATLAVARRPAAPAARLAHGAAGPPRAAARWRPRWLECPAIDLSSSAIRARVRRGRSLRYLVPDAVARYIARHRLYGGAR